MKQRKVIRPKSIAVHAAPDAATTSCFKVSLVLPVCDSARASTYPKVLEAAYRPRQGVTLDNETIEEIVRCVDADLLAAQNSLPTPTTLSPFPPYLCSSNKRYLVRKRRRFT